MSNVGGVALSLPRESKTGRWAVPSLPHVRDYVELTKPRITWLILMSTGIGYFFGLRGAANWWQFLQSVHFGSLLHTIVGTGLLASRSEEHKSELQSPCN